VHNQILTVGTFFKCFKSSKMNLYVDIGINIQGLVTVCSRLSKLRHALYIFLSRLKTLPIFQPELALRS